MSEQTTIVREKQKTADQVGLAEYPGQVSLRQILLLGVPKRKRQEKKHEYRVIRLEAFF